MEENAKTNKEMYLEAKAEFFGKLDELSPGFYHAMHDKNGRLHEKRLENMAEWFARHADQFNKDQKWFMYTFVKANVLYLDKTCPRSDFTFEGMLKLARIADMKKRFESTTYELLVERLISKRSEFESFSHEEKTMFRELLKMNNPEHISPMFSVVFERLLEEWKKLFFEDMIKDEHYKDAYLYVSNLLEKTKKKDLHYYLNEQKIRDHLENGGKLKFVDYTSIHENPKYDYDEFVDQLVRFSRFPVVGETAHWVWLGRENEPGGMRWFTSPVYKVTTEKDKLIVKTFNTTYEFEIYEEKEAE